MISGSLEAQPKALPGFRAQFTALPDIRAQLRPCPIVAYCLWILCTRESGIATLSNNRPQLLAPPTAGYPGSPTYLDQQDCTASACLMIESCLYSHPMLGHSLRSCWIMLLCLQPCLIADSRQQYYLGEHSLWPHLTRSN